MNAKLFLKPAGLVAQMPESVLLLPEQRILLVRDKGQIFFQSDKLGCQEDSYYDLVKASGIGFQLDGLTAESIIAAHDSLLAISEDLNAQIAERIK